MSSVGHYIPEPGVTLGSYSLLSRLATGGMSEVWLATATELPGHPTVVLKTMLPHLASDPELVRLFRTEARLAMALRHRDSRAGFQFKKFAIIQHNQRMVFL